MKFLQTNPFLLTANTQRFVFLFCLLCFASSLFSQSVPELTVEFEADSRFGKAKGKFFETKVISLDKKSNTGKFEVKIPSINTGNSKRDSHLLEEDFFFASQFPTATLEISQLKVDGNQFQGKGKLSIRGISQEIPIGGAYTSSEGKETYSGSFTVSRKSYGILFDSVINPIQDIVRVDFQLINPLVTNPNPKK